MSQESIHEQEQEPRDKNVTVRVSASEKRDVVLVAAFHESTESDVMRDMRMAEIAAEADRIRASRQPVEQVA